MISSTDAVASLAMSVTDMLSRSRGSNGASSGTVEVMMGALTGVAFSDVVGPGVTVGSVSA